MHLEADREFVNRNWLLALEKLGISYVIGFKQNAKLSAWNNDSINKKNRRLHTLHRYMWRYNLPYLEVPTADEMVNYLIVVPNHSKQTNIKEDDQYIHLITNLPQEQLLKAPKYYRIRWKIECCYKHLKSNGFQLENCKS